MDTKECKQCKEFKDLKDFSPNNKLKSGRVAKCKKCLAINQRAYKLDRVEKYTTYMAEYSKANREVLLKKQRERYQQSQGNYCMITSSEYLKKVEVFSKKNTILHAMRRKRLRMSKDPVYRFQVKVRYSIYNSFKRACKGQFTKGERTVQIVGCSLEEFTSYIVSQFTEGMTLANHGEWHLDHIVPLATAITREDILRLNHYTNFQPLWAKDNLSKGAKII